MIRITRNYFFGKKNPSWIISSTYSPHLLQYISDNDPGIDTYLFPPKTGYVSCTVEILDPKLVNDTYKLPRIFTVFNGHAPDNVASGKILDSILQLLKAENMEKDSNPATLEIAAGHPTIANRLSYRTSDKKNWDVEYERERMFGHNQLPPIEFTKDWTHGSTIQLARFHTAEWNNDFILGNNCYSYACNILIKNPSQTRWAQPGFSYRMMPPTNDLELVQGLEQDGLRRLEYGMNPVKGTDKNPAWIVAIASGYPYTSYNLGEWDYHCFRKVWSGYKISFWAHKPGAARVTSMSHRNNHLIHDPEGEAKIFGYDNFLGYFAVCNAAICTIN